MANPNNVPLPLPPLLAGQLNVNLVPFNNPIGNPPTNAEIARETRHLAEVQRVELLGGLNDEQYGDALVRHHRILSTRSHHDGGIGLIGQLALLQQHLDQRFDEMDERFDQMDERFNQVDQRLILLETLRLVYRARTVNRRFSEDLDAQYLVVPKYTPGHPNFIPQVIPNVAFAGPYNIGDVPPDGLVPRTLVRFTEFSGLPLADLRRNLRGIFWFYNDNFLQIEANANRVVCSNVLQSVKTFLKDDKL